jgi:hypothetical protein
MDDARTVLEHFMPFWFKLFFVPLRFVARPTRHTRPHFDVGDRTSLD